MLNWSYYFIIVLFIPDQWEQVLWKAYILVQDRYFLTELPMLLPSPTHGKPNKLLFFGTFMKYHAWNLDPAAAGLPFFFSRYLHNTWKYSFKSGGLFNHFSTLLYVPLTHNNLNFNKSLQRDHRPKILTKTAAGFICVFLKELRLSLQAGFYCSHASRALEWSTGETDHGRLSNELWNWQIGFKF